MKQELDLLRERMHHDLPFRSTPPFHIGVATEPTVQVLFRDFVASGTFVFDLGANIGSLTQALSRLVGPFGCVISVEANPQTIPSLTANIVKNALFNCFVVNEAMWHTPGEYVNIVDDGAATSVTTAATAGAGLVKTTTIDDLCSRFGRSPSFIKVDIEGAEYEAFRGATRLLETTPPPIVFEHNAGDDRALELLHSMDYWTMNASSYREVGSSADLDPECDVTNILALPRSSTALRYRNASVETFLVSAPFEDVAGPGPAKFRICLDLQPGRYIVGLAADCDERSVIYTRVSFNGHVIGELCTVFVFFIRNHKDLVFDADVPGRYTFEVGELPSAFEGQLAPQGASLRRVTFT